MKSAEAFAGLLNKGIGAETALSSLPTYQLQYIARVSIEVYRAAQLLRWRFFPVPRFGRERNNLLILHATNNVEMLKAWARSRPYWALATGRCSGVLILVVDGERGQNSIIRLCGDDWDWLGTLRTQAGQKRFIFFAWPSDRRQISGSIDLGNGLRVLGDDDWLLFPPSREANGAVHVFLNPQFALAQTPSWLLDRIFPLDGEDGCSRSFSSGDFGPSALPQIVARG